MAGLPERGLTETELADLRAEYEAGASALDVLAARFSMSRSVLSGIARRLNFGARPPALPFHRRAAAPPPPDDEGSAQSAPDRSAPPAPRARLASAADARPKASGARKTGAKKSGARKSGVAAAKPSAPRARPRAMPRAGPCAMPCPAGSPATAASTRRAAASEGRACATPDRRPSRAKPAKPLDIDAMAESLRIAAERELTEIHDRLEAGEDVERRARALASLVKTLADLARLAESRGGAATLDAGDVGAWTLDDLDAEIERQIDFIARSEAPAAAIEAPAGSGEARDP